MSMWNCLKTCVLRGTGKQLRNCIRDTLQYDFSFPHMRVIFPTAPMIPYTLLGGMPFNVWFDRDSLEPTGTECLSSIDSMALQLKKLVQAEIASGIPESRIVIGGFSMGASMALQLGLRYFPNVAAVVSLSTFLYNDSEIYRILENDTTTKRPKVLFCHGDKDELIDINWGKNSCDRLSKFGIQTSFKSISGLDHSMNIKELDLVKSWVIEQVPDHG